MIPSNISLNPDSRVLILGLGAGTVAGIITRRFGMVSIDGVEIDPLVVDLGKKYFGMTGQNLNIIVGDAAEYVKGARYKYDLVCLDVFVGGEVPKEEEDETLVKNIKALLKPEGILSINRIIHDKGKGEVLEAFLRKTFKEVQISLLKGNTIIFASDSNL